MDLDEGSPLLHPGVRQIRNPEPSIQHHLPTTRQHRLLRRAVATIPSSGLRLGFQMIVKLNGQHTFRQCLLQFVVDQAVLGK